MSEEYSPTTSRVLAWLENRLEDCRRSADLGESLDLRRDRRYDAAHLAAAIAIIADPAPPALAGAQAEGMRRAAEIADRHAIDRIGDVTSCYRVAHAIRTAAHKLAAEGAPLPAVQPSILWCCHVRGPDDVVATPDYASALELADKLLELDRRHGRDPYASAVPAPWPWTAELHAEDLARRALPDAEYPLPAAPAPAGKGEA